MNVEIAGDEELMGCGSSRREETVELFEENRKRFRECRRQRRTVDVEDRYLGTRELESNRRGLKGGEGWNRGRKLREGFSNEKASAAAVWRVGT